MSACPSARVVSVNLARCDPIRTRKRRRPAYLGVIAPGSVSAGDQITVSHRPDHAVTVAIVFRGLTCEPELLPTILAAAGLPEETRAMAAEGRTFSIS